MLLYELKRAFGRRFALAIALGFLSGMVGLVPYYITCTYHQGGDFPNAISCYEAWLFCFTVAESSLYKALFPLLICIPYLHTFYEDRKSPFIYTVLSRTSYGHYFKLKLFVGVLSACAVICAVLLSWLAVVFILFPNNPPTTDVSYLVQGAFSQFYKVAPLKYIFINIVLNSIFAAIFYVFSVALSQFAKNKLQVVIFPFVVFILAIILTQMFDVGGFSPINLIIPLESTSQTAYQLMAGMLVWLIVGCSGVLYLYKRDKREIL